MRATAAVSSLKRIPSLLPEAGTSLQPDGLDFTSSSFPVSPVDFHSVHEVKIIHFLYAIGQLQDRILLRYRDSEWRLAAFIYQFLYGCAYGDIITCSLKFLIHCRGNSSVCVIGC